MSSSGVNVVRGLGALALAGLVLGVGPATGAAPAPASASTGALAYRAHAAADGLRAGPLFADVRSAAHRARAATGTAGGRALSRSAALALTPCEDDPAFLCGTLPVPLDRRHPDGRVVNLHVEVFPHFGPQPQADGAVFVTEGGPGFSVSLGAKYGYAFFLLAELAQTRDLVFIDQRGVGLSDVIDCPAWQHGGPFYRSAARCHDQLGDTADLYSTTDVADDLDDVRKALGYRKIDLVGGSYGGTDMLTYATRHARHVRSATLGAPVVPVGLDPFFSYSPLAYPDLVDTMCARSPGCAAANGDPAGTLAWLAKRLRHHPVTGTGIDSAGVPHRVTVTENLLATSIMFFDGWVSVGPGTIVQAAKALRRGDKVPLLRLAANVDPANGFDSGDVREYSNGHNLARGCVDLPVQWDKQAGLGKRVSQYAAAYRAEPARYGPVSKAAWAAPGYRGFIPAPCIAARWEDRPSYRPGKKISGVPALVLGGDLDMVVPNSLASRATDVLVDADFVNLKASGHVPWWYSDCGPQIVQEFINTLEPGDTTCADEPTQGWWMPGSFPATMWQAPPALQSGGSFARRGLRRLATVVAWTVMDGIQHNIASTPLSAGLRGGSVSVEFDPDTGVPTLTFGRARFTKDVSVSGAVTWTDVLDGTFRVRGPGDRVTTASVDGPFAEAGQDVTVTLRTGGGTAAFSVPGY